MSQIVTTLGALVNAAPAPPAFSALDAVLAVPLDAKARYHVLKLAKLVATETAHFTAEHTAAIKALGKERQPTPEEHARGQRDPVTEVTQENRSAYFARIAELQAVPVTIPWGPITSTMLEPYPQITGAVCLALGPLFELVEPVESGREKD